MFSLWYCRFFHKVRLKNHNTIFTAAVLQSYKVRYKSIVLLYITMTHSKTISKITCIISLECETKLRNIVTKVKMNV
jgi:hypothetical protein